MTVDPELQQRAEEWCLAHGLTYGVEEDIGKDVAHEALVNSLALAFHRERLMGQIEGIKSVYGCPKWFMKNALDKRRTQLASLGDGDGGTTNG